MSGLFCGCSSLTHLPDISKWNTKNVEDMSFMFCRFSFPLPIKNLPNSFEKLNNKDFIDILIEANEKERQFLNAMISVYSKNNLEFELPDISKWDTSNVTTIKDIISV